MKPGVLLLDSLFTDGKGKLSDTIDALEPLRKKRDFALSSVMALLFFHKRQTRADESEIQGLEIAVEMTGANFLLSKPRKFD